MSSNQKSLSMEVIQYTPRTYHPMSRVAVKLPLPVQNWSGPPCAQAYWFLEMKAEPRLPHLKLVALQHDSNNCFRMNRHFFIARLSCSPHVGRLGQKICCIGSGS